MGRRIPKSSNLINGYPPDFTEEDITLVQILCAMKQKKLDREEALNLRQLMMEANCKEAGDAEIKGSSNSRLNLSLRESPQAEEPAEEEEEEEVNINNSAEKFMKVYKPLDLPPFESLSRNCILECTKALVKQVQESDVRVELNRLFLNKDDVVDNFLPLLKKDESVRAGIAVTTYDSDGEEYSMVFKFWSNKFYVLNGGWKSFFQKHELRMHEDFVTVWMFRHSQNQKLCFAINVTRVQGCSQLPPKKKKERSRLMEGSQPQPQPMKNMNKRRLIKSKLINYN